LETQNSSNSFLRADPGRQAKRSLRLALVTWFAIAIVIVFKPVTSNTLEDTVAFILFGIFLIICPIVSVLFGFLSLRELKNEQEPLKVRKIAISGIVISSLYLFLVVYQLFYIFLLPILLNARSSV